MSSNPNPHFLIPPDSYWAPRPRRNPPVPAIIVSPPTPKPLSGLTVTASSFAPPPQAAGVSLISLGVQAARDQGVVYAPPPATSTLNAIATGFNGNGDYIGNNVSGGPGTLAIGSYAFGYGTAGAYPYNGYNALGDYGFVVPGSPPTAGGWWGPQTGNAPGGWGGWSANTNGRG
ncbi:hypothetical protein EX30DRAFT_397446 [Ascodesmis nigricans]|uniref:Uncharacterized protein n=1 Tax=Ascodesmis nigricans TaxID=341454 RepID=A0A4S2MP93_9PEZI|nr:hypothetical protein EX30DRAFT_397446 [Ascodesmis nigricans]